MAWKRRWILLFVPRFEGEGGVEEEVESCWILQPLNTASIFHVPV